jgi:hypothetical protein
MGWQLWKGLSQHLLVDLSCLKGSSKSPKSIRVLPAAFAATSKPSAVTETRVTAPSRVCWAVSDKFNPQSIRTKMDLNQNAKNPKNY